MLRSGVNVDRESNAGSNMPAFSGVMWKHFASVLVNNKGCKCTENKFPGNERHFTMRVSMGMLDVVALLLDWDIDVSIQRGKEVEYVNPVNVSTQATPLHFATHSNSLRCVQGYCYGSQMQH